MYLPASPLLVSKPPAVSWVSLRKVEDTNSFVKTSGSFGWGGEVVVNYAYVPHLFFVDFLRQDGSPALSLSFPRMGWFVPSSIVQELWTHQNIMADHWKALRIQSVARAFSWWGRPEWRELCPSCEMLAYRSLHCTRSRKRRNCATLFASVNG